MTESDDISFLDIVCVLHITPETTLEKFGSVINASVFDAANIAGSLKQKGLINFNAGFPGPTGIEQTDTCKVLLNNADAKSAEPVDKLDDEILNQLSGGKRLPLELQSTLNLAQKDMALRLYKLYKQGCVTYELRNGNVELLLTEKGFLRAKASSFEAPQESVSEATPEEGGAAPVAQAAQAAAPAQTAQAPQPAAKAQAKRGPSIMSRFMAKKPAPQAQQAPAPAQQAQAQPVLRLHKKPSLVPAIVAVVVVIIIAAVLIFVTNK